ncbi:repA [Exomis microphylla associated virus]|uniref:Replication-associated protein n=1 Tax=Exomis microphylla associated virus TaxID=2093275 RepID=A0A2I8B2L4_9GEMI|nr:repA [Exomis microphylla associated virus]AUT11877.1 repA [Exomis microphylla associated virus]
MRIFFRPPTQKSNQLFLTYSYSFKMPRVPNRNRPASSYTAYYRFQKKNAFLTYSQIGGDFKDYIFEKLHTLLLPYEILFLAVSLEHHSPTEEHPEGGFHTHCIFQCNKKLQVNGNLFFNILLPNGKELHPRIDGLNAPKRAMDYITKEDTNPRTMGELRSSGRSPNSVGRSNDEWRRILDASNTKDEFLNNVRESCPTDYVLRWPSILSFANYHYREIVPPYTPRWTEFNGLPDIVKQWAEDNIYFVSESTFNYDLCNNCKGSVLTDNDYDIIEHYELWLTEQNLLCNEDINDTILTPRSQTTDQSVQEVCTSADLQEQEKPNGQDL